jgi:hypothetical protein
MQGDATEMISRLAQLKSDRSQFDVQWDDISEYVGGSGGFAGTPKSLASRGIKSFDSTAQIDLDRFAATMASLMTPQNEQWHKLEIDGDEDSESKVYLEDVNSRLFSARYAHTSGFPSQIHEFYRALGRYGTSVMAIMDLRGIKYRNIPLRECWLEENWQGQIDTIWREYELTGRQAIQQFGEKLPEQVAKLADQKPGEKFKFVQKVCPNENRDATRKDFKGMAFASYDICLRTKQIIGTGGYRVFPFTVGRFSASQGEVYGRSPAMQALPTIKMLNEMKKTNLRSAHRMVDPPLLLSDDQTLGSVSLVPGALIRGGAKDGKAQVIPLMSGGSIPTSLEIMDRERKTIHDAFFVSLFEILADDRRNMTAQEVLHRAQEKGDLLGPISGELQVSVFGPMIDRELDILEMAGQLPPIPQSVADAGGFYKIRYTSPITRAQKAGEGIAVLRTLEAAVSVSQIDPKAINALNGSEMLRILADAQGLPAKAMRSREEVEEMSVSQDQQAQAAQLLEGASVAADSARSLAQAQAYSAAPGIAV